MLKGTLLKDQGRNRSTCSSLPWTLQIRARRHNGFARELIYKVLRGRGVQCEVQDQEGVLPRCRVSLNLQCVFARQIRNLPPRTVGIISCCLLLFIPLLIGIILFSTLLPQSNSDQATRIRQLEGFTSVRDGVRLSVAFVRHGTYTPGSSCWLFPFPFVVRTCNDS